MKNSEILSARLPSGETSLVRAAPMVGSNEEALLTVIDRIYESVEAPELWPQTIYAVGELIGGRCHFWGPDQDSSAGVNRRPQELEIGCYGTFFLFRQYLQALIQYATHITSLSHPYSHTIYI